LKPGALNYFIRGVVIKVCVFPTAYDTTSSFVSFCSSRVSCFLCVLPPSIDGLFVLLTIVRVESLERVSQLLLSLGELCALFFIILGLRESGLLSVMAIVILMLKCASEKTIDARRG
jgi:hypothetical protein